MSALPQPATAAVAVHPATAPRAERQSGIREIALPGHVPPSGSEQTTTGWAYEVSPAAVRALRQGERWFWRVTQEASIEDDARPCRGRVQIEIDGRSGQLTSVRHQLWNTDGHLDICALGTNTSLQDALLTITRRTVREVRARRGDVDRTASDEQLYKLAGLLQHLCRAALRNAR